MEENIYPSMTPSAPNDVESMINKQLQKVSSFNNSIQNISLMMKYYELEEKKYKKKFTKCKLINNIINSTDGLIKIGTTSASVTLSITGVGIIVVPITAGVGCATGILVKICSSYLKKKEQNYKLKYAIIQKTLDDLRQIFATSLKNNHIDEKKSPICEHGNLSHSFTITNYNKQACKATRTASRYNNTDYNTDIAYTIA